MSSVDISAQDAAFTETASLVASVYGIEEGTPVSKWKPSSFEQASPRYLWSDAYGVACFLSMHMHKCPESKSSVYLDRAIRLVHEVHNVLGRQRHSNDRLGNASDERPTLAGLRIGKAAEEHQEDGDGQYFHYLTKWMFSLCRLSELCGDPKYTRWALDLAVVAHDRFVYKVGREGDNNRRMYWKMSIDLSRPLVPSQGNLDAFDGLVMFRYIRECSRDQMVLSRQIRELEQMVKSKQFSPSYDPLDLGEALWLTSWCPSEDREAMRIQRQCLQHLDQMFRSNFFSLPPEHRLMFREMGTTIGIQSLEMKKTEAETSAITWNNRVKHIHRFWSVQGLFTRDRSISPLMYAASRLPLALLRSKR